MTPTPQECRPCLDTKEVVQGLNGESVVISGMSGLFPMSHSVKELSTILYNQVNPVTSEGNRWKFKHPEVSEYTGKVPDIDRFDSQFFMVHRHLGEVMDPMARKVLEQSYQAIYDAGLSPKNLNGKKVGVYIGSAFSETERLGVINTTSKTGYGITGVSKTMYANRVSYWLNAKGPSLSLDDACCSSMVALEEAFKAISSGICEAAIVGGTNLCLTPIPQVHYNRCVKISHDGKTKSFDEHAEGCTRSEAISVMFLQKAKNALRAYAEIVHIKSEFISKLSGEFGQIFGFIRNPDITAEFLKTFYSEARILPQQVEYIEACGSATPEADKAELQAIEKVFCDQRTDPLLVGSVISNVGFTDAASGATAITKVLLGYHNGLIASNLHCQTPRQDIPAIRDGRMCIVTEHQPFRGTYAAVNCLSVTGVNSHVLLHSCSKPKNLSRYTSSFPRLVTVSARQKEYLEHIFEDLKSRPIDAEELALLQNIHSTNVTGHLGKGYIILDTDEQQKTVALSETMEHSDEMQRPLWYVYSGMGSQWAGMGAQLMRIPIFAAAIERCQKVLPTELDVVHIISSPDKAIFDNILNSFVGIAAVQIGLTDILKALGLHPDMIIGHSVGELGCAYADGCLTAEEMILSAYSRGKASNDTPLIRGAMAAVGLGFQELSQLCPPTIQIACHNSTDSSTISGPEENIREFLALLTAKGIFAKEVPSSNIAYHSRYIADAGPNLLSRMSKIIREPKARSKRWLSTSVPQEKWNEPIAKYCSPEYLTNNLLSSVLFEETCRLIPNNAVLVEIAPHGLMQAILRRSLPQTCKNIPLAQRGHKDNALFLLDAIGKLYIEGYNPQIQAIYPKVEFPVSTGTPHLANFVKWFHSESWTVATQKDIFVKSASFCKFLISTHDDEHAYLKGNVVQGKNLYSFAGALVAVWDTLAMTLGFPKKEISVHFHDVHLYTQPILHDQKQLELNVSLHRGNGHFEVLDGDSKLATGYIFSNKESIINLINTKDVFDNFIISSDEIYEHLRSRGYTYREEFRSIQTVDESLAVAQILWNDNWVTLIDGMLQLNSLRHTYEGVSQPTQIRELTIDTEKHLESIQQSSLGGKTVLRAEVNELLDWTRCGGILLQNIKFRNLPYSNQSIIKWNTSTLSNSDENNTSRKIFEADIKTILQIRSIGNLDTLHWEETSNLSESGVKILVEYAGINMLDVKRSTGVIPIENSEKYYGMDFSGLTKSGERVIGLVRNGAISTVVSAQPELLWPVPSYWTLEEAATVPLAYLQAFYYLCVKNELVKGWKVLVHGAVGALGQAAISVALAHGCQVFATVGDSAKKRFLLKIFPQLDENVIGNSRDDSFGDMVLHATHGKGCNIVISCVQDDLKNISLKCAAFSGVTIDMVQIQDRDKYEYGMFHMTKQRSYIAADFYSVLDSGNKTEIKKLQTLLSDGIARGFVRPLSHVTFAPHEAPRAFRLLAASCHRGRVLLRLRDSLAPAQPRVICSPECVHLIVWDGSSFGLQLADRLIARGATKLRICCLQPTSGQLLKLRLWKKIGVDVVILPDVLTHSDAVSAVFNETQIREHIEGIYVATTEGDLTGKRCSEIAKIIENLDINSRKIYPLLKYFAVITAHRSIGPQTCLSRSKDGFPATALLLTGFNKENNKLGEDEEFVLNQSAVDVTELALRSKSSVLSAEPQDIEQPSLFKLIAASTENDAEDLTLKDLGMGKFMPFIKSYLRDVYHISLDDKDILMLTKKRLLEIEMNLSECNFEEVKGLRIFFSNEDLDELQATTDLVALNTLVSDETKRMEVTFDESRPHLFIIPGLEGHHARFHALCKRLKISAFVLQPGLNHPDETPKELATRYSKVLQEKFKLKTKNFYLLGYELGIIVALELASILEDNGLTGTVYCIGDGPDEIKALLETEMRAYDSEEALQEGVVRHMYSLLASGSAALTEVAPRGCSSWSAHIDACVRTLLGYVPHSAQYARALIKAAYERIVTARRYSAAPRALRSRLVLLRARGVPDSGEECSLQRYSRLPLVVTDLAAPMAHAAADLRAPTIINKYLDEEILKAFEMQNLCESYLFNTDVLLR